MPNSWLGIAIGSAHNRPHSSWWNYEDTTVSLEEARRRSGGKVALQGNLDPATLYGSPDAIRDEVR